MRFLFLAGVLVIVCSCSAPKLATDGNIRCRIYDGGPIGRVFDYPSDAKSRQILDEWLNYYNAQSYWLTLAEAQVPAISLDFTDSRTHVYLYDRSSCIHVSPLSVRQYKRMVGDKDKEFMNYLRQIPNN